ncbi:zinc finger MYM-type protein 1 [Cucumis sativus]|uniref:zinc finger MYM-type protein 1 n=1 Tax=Cucumis sativus TaxID=3659 RepID=UPI0012F486BE|nr:zinc finger MYM-type protein 1 [Cucumis sativus]
MSDQAKIDYWIRLGATIDCARFLLQQGLPFRGHDETEDSKNQGNFFELLQWFNYNKHIEAVSLRNAPENLKLTAPDIQKDIVNCIGVKIVNGIIGDNGDKLLSILIDELKDISSKEQMSIVLRYVDKGCVIERFVGIIHVTNTSLLSLKEAITRFFSIHGLSMASLRGQGYDGASNMQGEFNGLKILILRENECAFYIHCFSHQLQLALVAIAKNHVEIVGLFILVVNVVSVIGASEKHRDMLKEKHSANTFEALNNGELSSGRGLNQETKIKRPGDT